MKGTADIPALRLEVLNKFIDKIPTPQELFFANLFPEQTYPSDSIRWELEYGNMGMTPFVAPGAPAPAMGDNFIYQEGSARAAYWKEKVFLDEVMLNNLRQPLTVDTYWTAERQMSRKTRKLKTRSTRRRDWMIAKMLFDGQLVYQQEGGLKFTVNYGIPSTHNITLTGTDKWDDEASNPIEDIFDAKKVVKEDSGASVKYAMLNSELLKILMFRSDFQTLLQKSAFGEGDLFANPEKVIGNLLGVGTLAVYDELFEISEFLSSDASAGTSTLYVDDASNFEDESTARVVNMSQRRSWEDITISSVDKSANTITLATNLSSSYKANRDRVIMRKKYIYDDTFFMFTDTVDGEKIAEVMKSPFGLDRRWGQYVDKHEEWDPDGVWLRCQNKGLPVLYNPDAVFKLTVK